MKQKTGTFTESEMERGRWWWRRLVFAHFDPATFTTARLTAETEGCKRLWLAEFPERASELTNTLAQEFDHWQTGQEVGAWRYELVRRMSPEREFVDLVQSFHCGNAPNGATEHLLPKSELDCILLHLMPGGRFPTWPYLVSPARSGLRGLAEYLNKSVQRIEFPTRTEHGWSEPSKPFQWDLLASDSELSKMFLLWINEQRRKQGIPDSVFPELSQSGKRKSHNKGNRHRKVSWRWPEVLDIHRFGTRPLTGSERSMKSDAEAEALKWKPVLLRGLSQVAYRPGFTPDSWQPHHFPVRWLQENFDRWYPAKARGSLPK